MRRTILAVVAAVGMVACEAEQDLAPDVDPSAGERARNFTVELPRVAFGETAVLSVRDAVPNKRISLAIAWPGDEACFATDDCLAVPLRGSSGTGACVANKRGRATCLLTWPYDVSPGSTARAWQNTRSRTWSDVWILDVPYCGDGWTDPGEGCDDGNGSDYDGCSSWCQVEYPQCGNSIVEFGEECDDGGWIDGDGCSSDCKWSYYAYCGNGVTEAYEQCDDGGNANYDGCSEYCEWETAFCGNYVVEYGEECDDGGYIDGDGCSSDCRFSYYAYCGNGVTEVGEDCDDGGYEPYDGCDPYCFYEQGP